MRSRVTARAPLPATVMVRLRRCKVTPHSISAPVVRLSVAAENSARRPRKSSTLSVPKSRSWRWRAASTPSELLAMPNDLRRSARVAPRRIRRRSPRRSPGRAPGFGRGHGGEAVAVGHPAVMRHGDQLAAHAGQVLLDGVLVHPGGHLVLVGDDHDGVAGQVFVAVAGQPVQRAAGPCAADGIAGRDDQVVRGLQDAAHGIVRHARAAVDQRHGVVGGDELADPQVSSAVSESETSGSCSPAMRWSLPVVHVAGQGGERTDRLDVPEQVRDGARARCW